MPLTSVTLIGKISIIHKATEIWQSHKGVMWMEEKLLQAIQGRNKRFDSLENKMDSLENKVDSLEVQIKETTQILKALEHSSRSNKAEHDAMTLHIADISGDVKTIRRDLPAVEIVTANNWSDIARLKAVK